jgi:drug/metabolite transporter (DMT)-like permease
MTDAVANSSPHAVAHNPRKGFAYSLAGIALIAWTTFIFAKFALDKEKGFSPGMFGLLWTSSASVYLTVILAVRGRLRDVLVPRAVAVKLLIAGLFAGVAHILFWSGLSLLDASFTAFLARFAPVLVILGSVVFLRERLKWIEVPAIGVMVLGGCVSSIGDWNVVGTGVVLIMLSAVAAATWRLIFKAHLQQIPPMGANIYRLGMSALVLLVWVTCRGEWAVNADGYRWTALLVGAFLGPCVAMTLLFTSYRYWDLSRASMVWMAEPLFVLPIAAFLPGASLTMQQFIGGMIILAGGFWLVWQHYARQQDDKGTDDRSVENTA